MMGGFRTRYGRGRAQGGDEEGGHQGVSVPDGRPFRWRRETPTLPRSHRDDPGPHGPYPPYRPRGRRDEPLIAASRRPCASPDLPRRTAMILWTLILARPGWEQDPDLSKMLALKGTETSRCCRNATKRNAGWDRSEGEGIGPAPRAGPSQSAIGRVDPRGHRAGFVIPFVHQGKKFFDSSLAVADPPDTVIGGRSRPSPAVAPRSRQERSILSSRAMSPSPRYCARDCLTSA